MKECIDVIRTKSDSSYATTRRLSSLIKCEALQLVSYQQINLFRVGCLVNNVQGVNF